MALGWIKVRTDLQTHPKVVRISSALRADRFRVIGGLHAVWSIFDAHSLDGTLDGYTTETLDALIGWPGFSAAMAAVEWLKVSEDSLEVPRFDEHNGANAKRRAEDAVRKRLARASASGPQEVREMSAKKPDIARTESGPEKRREEKNSSPSGEESGARERAPRASKKAPESFVITDEMRAWANVETPNVDLSLETAKFCDHTFTSAKTDWAGTWRNWMRKAQEHARRPAYGAPINKQTAVEARNRAVAELWANEQG